VFICIFPLENGTIYACGSNENSVLGFESENQVIYIPQKCTSEFRFRDIECGWTHNFAITSNLTLIFLDEIV
jgi:alpha-tubulin suppressor-like RCC1 family protein